ncbi:MAG: LptF/LptG family permease [Candidatus Sericytochromatia bacterium]
MITHRIIDRYISLEVVRPFLLIVVGVIVIMLSVRLSTDMQLIIVNKVPAPIVLRMIAYKMPEFIVLGLPIAYMIATLLGLARMSKDFELIAIRATGTGSKRIMRPILLISMLVSAGAYYINEEIVPQANARSQLAAEAVAQADGAGPGPATNIQFKGVDSRFFFAQVVNKKDKVLERVQIFDSDPSHPYRIITAQRGTWQGTKWTLTQGVVQQYPGEVDAFVDQEFSFDELVVETRINIENYLSGDIKPKEMGSEELRDLIAATRAGGQESRPYEIEYQAKFARPFATFFAALIAAPIGLKFARGGYIGFAISIILTFFYFVAQTMGEGFGNLGLVPVLVAAWLPNLMFGVLGILFYFQVE